MKAKSWLIVWAVITCLIAIMTLNRLIKPPGTELRSQAAVPVSVAAPPPAIEPPSVVDNPTSPLPPSVIDAPPPVPSKDALVRDVPPPTPAPLPQTPQKQPRPKPQIVDPMARDALALVGLDPDAEQYWVSAINNPDIPPKERKDLIEDLNEDGLPDPKHPSLEDLPLILNRLELIEELAPNSMDPGNAKAFAEAYKDLVNLANRATGGGRPVR